MAQIDEDVVINGNLTVNGDLTITGVLSCAKITGPLNLDSQIAFRDGNDDVVVSLNPIQGSGPGWLLQIKAHSDASVPAVEITTDGTTARELLSLAVQDASMWYLRCHKSDYTVAIGIGWDGKIH